MKTSYKGWKSKYSIKLDLSCFIYYSNLCSWKLLHTQISLSSKLPSKCHALFIIQFDRIREWFPNWRLTLKVSSRILAPSLHACWFGIFERPELVSIDFPSRIFFGPYESIKMKPNSTRPWVTWSQLWTLQKNTKLS